MLSNDTITGLIPVLPRLIGYQPRNVATIVGIDTIGVVAGCATWRDQDHLNGQTIHGITRRLNSDNPTGQPLSVALVVLWNSHDDSSDLEWLALDVATSAHPSATAVTVVQADPDTPRWRRAAGTWTDTDPTSPLVAHTVADGIPAPAGELADRRAAWQHDPTWAATVAGHTDHTWIGNTLTARASIVDDVWATILATDTHPEQAPEAIGTVIAALNGPYWLRDTLMLRAAQHWSQVAATLAAAVRAANTEHTANTAAATAMAAFTAGDELAGREALIRAVTADPGNNLTALLDRAESAGMPMTRTCRDVIATMPEHTTLSVGLQ